MNHLDHKSDDIYQKTKSLKRFADLQREIFNKTTRKPMRTEASESEHLHYSTVRNDKLLEKLSFESVGPAHKRKLLNEYNPQLTERPAQFKRPVYFGESLKRDTFLPVKLPHQVDFFHRRFHTCLVNPKPPSIWRLRNTGEGI